jgi:hypothetical protein
MDKFRLILSKIHDCIELQNGATESQLKTIWNDLSDAISESERGQNNDTSDSGLHLQRVSVSLPTPEEIWEKADEMLPSEFTEWYKKNVGYER